MSSSFYENKDCEYYPCHFKGQNCLFCYCPLYFIGCDGLGSPKFIENRNGVRIKDCSNCVFPHKKDSYVKIVKKLTEYVNSKDGKDNG